MLVNKTVYLGSVVFTNCDALLIIEGVEVFRLRERDDHESWRGVNEWEYLVEFDVRDQNDNRIAKVTNNNVVHASPGYEKTTGVKSFRITNRATGEIVAGAHEDLNGAIYIMGDFWVKGTHVKIDDTVLDINTNILYSCTFNNKHNALVIENGRLRL